MDPKILTESGWKSAAVKYKIKGNDLQKVLAQYDRLEDDAHDELLECIAEIRKEALALKKAREAAAVPAALKYLADLISALEAEQRDIAKDKAEAEKLLAEAKKRAAQEKGKPAEDEEDEEEEEDEEYGVALLTALHKLKGAKDAIYEFIVCDAKPHCGVMVAKKIAAKHKVMLTEITGSKRFLPIGQCRMDEGKFRFEMEKPVSGLARKLQLAIKNYTGKKLPIQVGNEAADADEDEEGAAGIGTLKLPKVELATAPQVWHGTRDVLHKSINALKSAIQAKYAGENPDFVDKINNDMEKMGNIVERLDGRLADSLTKAHDTKDAAGRATELAKAKTILAEYIKYVKAEPLIEHIDANPFGVKTNLKAVLANSLTHMAKAIG
jgi:hypothetical protein